MAKHRSRSKQNKVRGQKSFTIQLPLPVPGALTDMREAFYALCIETGRQVLMAMMESDLRSAARAKGQCRRKETTAYGLEKRLDFAGHSGVTPCERPCRLQRPGEPHSFPR